MSEKCKINGTYKIDWKKRNERKKENYIYEKQNIKNICFNPEIGIIINDNCFQKNSVTQKKFFIKDLYLFSLFIVRHDSSIPVNSDVLYIYRKIVVSTKSSCPRQIENNLLRR